MTSSTTSREPTPQGWRALAILCFSLFLFTVFVRPSAPRPAPPVCTPTSAASSSESRFVPMTGVEAFDTTPTSPAASAAAAVYASAQAADQTRPRVPWVELVRSSVGRWKGETGEILEIDPPRPKSGSRPPYHAIFRLPKQTLGCDFTDPADGDVAFRAWCGGVAKSEAVRIRLDARDGRTLVASLWIGGGFTAHPTVYTRIVDRAASAAGSAP